MAMPDSKLTFKSIGIQGHSVGQCIFTGEELLWSSRDGEARKTMEWSKTEKALWGFFGRYGHLRLLPKDGTHPMRLDGFSKNDYSVLKEFLSARGVELVKERINASGGNYGEMGLGDHNSLEFRDDEGRSIFSINMKDISQCVLPGNNRKGNDVELQFNESDAVDQAEDALVEMRFCLPAGDMDGDDANAGSAAEAFQQQVMSRANIHDVKGNVLVEFDASQGTFLTPRGRYTIEMYGAFMRMHGSKYDYKIQYEDISRLYLLEKADDRFYAFVISLDKPIRQGQQRYQHLVLQTTSDEGEVHVHMKEEELTAKFEGLMPVMSGPMSNLIAKCFKALSKKPVYVTGKFRSQSGAKCVACALGANDGLLYPLNKSFIFIHKPTRVISFDEIQSVEFQRYGGAQGTGATRNFDLCVTLNSMGGEPGKEVVFSGIDRQEFSTLDSFLSTKKIKVKSVKEDVLGSGILDSVMEDTHDPYKEAAMASAAMGDEDEESADDADYQPGAAGSDHGDVSDDDSGSGGSGSDSGGEGSSTPKKKASKKASKRDEDGGKPPKASKAAADKPPKKRKKAAEGEEGDGGGSSKKAKASKGSSNGGKEKGEKGDGKAKKPRKKKDKDAPKGASSAFMQFSKVERANVVKDHPEFKVPDVGRELGLRWKALDQEARTPFNELAAKDKERYKREMAAYNEKKKAESFVNLVAGSGDGGGGSDDGGASDEVDSD